MNKTIFSRFTAKVLARWTPSRSSKTTNLERITCQCFCSNNTPPVAHLGRYTLPPFLLFVSRPPLSGISSPQLLPNYSLKPCGELLRRLRKAPTLQHFVVKRSNQNFSPTLALEISGVRALPTAIRMAQFGLNSPLTRPVLFFLCQSQQATGPLPHCTSKFGRH